MADPIVALPGVNEKTEPAKEAAPTTAIQQQTTPNVPLPKETLPTPPKVSRKKIPMMKSQGRKVRDVGKRAGVADVVTDKMVTEAISNLSDAVMRGTLTNQVKPSTPNKPHDFNATDKEGIPIKVSPMVTPEDLNPPMRSTVPSMFKLTPHLPGPDPLDLESGYKATRQDVNMLAAKIDEKLEFNDFTTEREFRAEFLSKCLTIYNKFETLVQWVGRDRVKESLTAETSDPSKFEFRIKDNYEGKILDEGTVALRSIYALMANNGTLDTPGQVVFADQGIGSRVRVDAYYHGPEYERYLLTNAQIKILASYADPTALRSHLMTYPIEYRFKQGNWSADRDFVPVNRADELASLSVMQRSNSRSMNLLFVDMFRGFMEDQVTVGEADEETTFADLLTAFEAGLTELTPAKSSALAIASGGVKNLITDIITSHLMSQHCALRIDIPNIMDPNILLALSMITLRAFYAGPHQLTVPTYYSIINYVAFHILRRLAAQIAQGAVVNPYYAYLITGNIIGLTDPPGQQGWFLNGAPLANATITMMDLPNHFARRVRQILVRGPAPGFQDEWEDARAWGIVLAGNTWQHNNPQGPANPIVDQAAVTPNRQYEVNQHQLKWVAINPFVKESDEGQIGNLMANYMRILQSMSSLFSTNNPLGVPWGPKAKRGFDSYLKTLSRSQTRLERSLYMVNRVCRAMSPFPLTNVSSPFIRQFTAANVEVQHFNISDGRLQFEQDARTDAPVEIPLNVVDTLTFIWASDMNLVTISRDLQYSDLVLWGVLWKREFATFVRNFILYHMMFKEQNRARTALIYPFDPVNIPTYSTSFRETTKMALDATVFKYVKRDRLEKACEDQVAVRAIANFDTSSSVPIPNIGLIRIFHPMETRNRYSIANFIHRNALAFGWSRGLAYNPEPPAVITGWEYFGTHQMDPLSPRLNVAGFSTRGAAGNVTITLVAGIWNGIVPQRRNGDTEVIIEMAEAQYISQSAQLYRVIRDLATAGWIVVFNVPTKVERVEVKSDMTFDRPLIQEISSMVLPEVNLLYLYERRTPGWRRIETELPLVMPVANETFETFSFYYRVNGSINLIQPPTSTDLNADPFFSGLRLGGTLRTFDMMNVVRGLVQSPIDGLSVL